MRIKHFSGYGSVNAQKVLMHQGVNERGEPHTLLIIDVAGDHERGLIPYIESDAAAWLLKYFDKPATLKQNTPAAASGSLSHIIRTG